MTLQNSGSLWRTPEAASRGGQQDPRASTSTSSSPRDEEQLQMRVGVLHGSVEESQRHEAATASSETTRATLPLLPPATVPDASRIPTQRAAAAASTQSVNHCGSGELHASPRTQCHPLEPKQPRVPQTQHEQQQQQQHQQQHMQEEQQKDRPLLPLIMPSRERFIEDFWPSNLARRPSAEMLQHLRAAARRHHDPTGSLAASASSPVKPDETVSATLVAPAELRRAGEDMKTAFTVVPPQKISGSSTKTRIANSGCDSADGNNSLRSSKSRSHSNWLGGPQQLPKTGDLACALAGATQPQGDYPVGPCDFVATGRPTSAAASTTETIGASRAGVRTAVNLTLTKNNGEPDSLRGTVPECHSADRKSSRSNNSSTYSNSTGNAQRLRCEVPSLGRSSPELLENAGGPRRQLPSAAVLDALAPSNGSSDSRCGILLERKQGSDEEKHLQHPLQQQPHKQRDMLNSEKKNGPQQGQQLQKQQQHQRPRNFVRRLTLGLLMGHRAGGKERRAWRGRCNGRDSSISQTQQDHKEQEHEQQEQQQRQQEKQQDDDAEWEACCLLQPADEKKDGLAAQSHSSSNSGTGLGGYRRAPSRLQRMAFSFGCFGESSQRRAETQRENCRSLTPAQYRNWRRQETYADDGSIFPRGLANLKNTCFLNAALQALAGIPCFVASLQAGLPPEPGVRETQWHGTPRVCDASHDGTKVAASAAAAAARSSTTASPDSEETRGQQAQHFQNVQHQLEEQTEQQKDLLQQQLIQRQELLRRLRLQQERREKHQPECLGSLDENQRRLLLREFFALLCRLTWAGGYGLIKNSGTGACFVHWGLTCECSHSHVSNGFSFRCECEFRCCPSIRPNGSAEETSTEELAAQRPRESNQAATCKLEQEQQQQYRQQQHMPVVEHDTIRPERLRKALVAPLAGLLLNDCNMQQQQDCHEFLRGLIDLIHEILKTCRWEREEAAAAEELLQLQAISPVADLEPWVLTSLGTLRIPLATAEDQQTQHLKKPSRANLSDTPSEGNESSETGKAVGGDVGDAERAEKKWREYIRDQASPMADFFAGQLCSEIQCAGCRQSLFIYEPAWDLSLPLPLDGNKVSLNSLLEGFFGSEELEFSCSSCHSPACKAHRTIRYTHPPKVLLLQIKRFSASGQKRRTRVEYPLEELVIKTNSESATFRLIAVIEHNGTSCQSGHYVAYVRRRRFAAPVAPPPSTAGTSGRPETPRSSACSPSEFLKRIGILKGFTNSASHSLRHPNGPSTAPLSGPSPREPPHGSPFRPPRPAMSYEGMADDGTEWFRFDDGVVLPVSEAEVFSAEAYCLFYCRTDSAEKQCSPGSKQESSASAGAAASSKLSFH